MAAMTVETVLALLPALRSLNSRTVLDAAGAAHDQPYEFTKKTRWNLAINLQRCDKVARRFMKERDAIIAKYSVNGVVAKDSQHFKTVNLEIEQLTQVECDDLTLLKLPADELSDLAIPPSVLAGLMPILDGKPADAPPTPPPSPEQPKA